MWIGKRLWRISSNVYIFDLPRTENQSNFQHWRSDHLSQALRRWELRITTLTRMQDKKNEDVLENWCQHVMKVWQVLAAMTKISRTVHGPHAQIFSDSIRTCMSDAMHSLTGVKSSSRGESMQPRPWTYHIQEKGRKGWPTKQRSGLHCLCLSESHGNLPKVQFF